MYRPELAAGVTTQPIVKAQRVQVGRGAYFEHHVTGAAPVGSAGWYQEKLVLFGWEGRDVLGNVHWRAILVCLLCFVVKGANVHAFPQAQEDSLVFTANHHVVRLVLGVGPPEHRPHVVLARVAVHGKVAAAIGVEVVEADGEGSAKGALDRGPEDADRVGNDDELERELHERPWLLADEDAGLRSDQFVTEGCVGRARTVPELELRPVASPGGRVERRAGAERPPG